MRLSVALIASLVSFAPGLSRLAAQQRSEILIDRRFSIPTGVVTTLAAEHLLTSSVDRVLPARLTGESTVPGKLLGIGYRAVKMGLVDIPITGTSMLALHEYYGHGSRIREFGFKASYEVSPPFPYGEGAGVTYWEYPDNRMLGPTELAMVSAGGMESDNLVAKELSRRWVSSERMTYQDARRFFFAFHDQFSYIHSDPGGAGDDVASYLGAVNSLRSKNGSKLLTRSDLQSQSLISLLSPQNLYATYAYFGKYFVGGTSSLPVPRIHLGDAEYLPYMRYSLSPFGSEFHFEQLVSTAGRVLSLDLRSSTDGPAYAWGAAGEATDVYQRGRVTLDAKAAIWKQPDYILGGAELSTHKVGLGGLAAGTARIGLGRKPRDGGRIHGVVQAGYKSAGFIEGERITSGFFLRLGIGLNSKGEN